MDNKRFCELVEQLKNNKITFGLLSKDEQSIFRKVERLNCEHWEYMDDNRAEWALCLDSERDNLFCPSETYRIKSSYQPPQEPKVVKCEIILNRSRLHFIYNGNIYGLHKAVNLAAFSHFEYENGEIGLTRRNFVGSDKPAEIPKYAVFIEGAE